jgi:hypothetical protein
MRKTSTFHFTINNLASKSKQELQDVNSVLDFEAGYEDVLKTLDELDFDVQQEVVDKILKLASKM